MQMTVESMADIEAEIRARAKAWNEPTLAQYDERLADRIKAAAKREREAREDLRTALMAVIDALDAVGFKPWTCDYPLEVAYSAANAALEKHSGGARVWCKRDPSRHCVDCEMCKGEGDLCHEV